MRKSFIIFSIITILALAGLSFLHIAFLIVLLFLFPLLAMGLYDAFQSKHTIRRNFPLFGRLRYLMETIRPGIQQYFVESDTNGMPFNRLQRSQIYARSKKETETVPFGTQMDVYADGYEWVNHSIRAIDAHTLDQNPRVKIGSHLCTQPYMASLFNISAMSFGSLSKNAILALNSGAKIGGFYHNTGEGGLSPHHLNPGGDVVWNIGTGYFSCRNADGTFNETEFAKRATLSNVKMIEVKFSQGAKPGHGGILPKQKVTQEIADIRLVPMGEDIVSPPFHTAFTTPKEFVHFVAKLRTLSGGKPIGMKICIGNKSEFLAICKAMISENICLDFITVDGGEGGTGAAPLEFSNSVGMPLREAIAFVYDALQGFDLKKDIKIICSGKITSGFEIVKSLSLGADVCNSARGMMFAIGCIQALQCNTNTCPTGVATQDENLVKGLVVDDKKTRVANYHSKVVGNAVELMAAAGISHPDDVGRNVVHRRVNATVIETYEETYPELEAGVLLTENTVPPKYVKEWQRASIDKF
jgi:glutamate synthase domain-containing protein 2